MATKHFWVQRSDLTAHKVVETEPAPLAPGAIELEIDLFGFTSNNVTYAALGDLLSYWQFFPADAGWGRIPVWGFATVSRSAAGDIAVGERFYGYYPMSSHLVVEAPQLDASGFRDSAPHRRPLPGIYNGYLRTSTDPSYRPDTEPHQVILRPLFGASFMLADWLSAERFFGADSVLFSSASSKSAIGTAFLLSQRRERELIGLTSSRHLDFVSRLGLYDRVIDYEALPTLPVRPTVYIDMAGNHTTTVAVHRHLADALRHSSIFGRTHWQATGHQFGLPGPNPVPFSTAARFRQRAEDWTPPVLQQRLADAWNSFLASASTWLHLDRGRGEAAVSRAYDEVIRGATEPNRAHVLSLASIE